MVTIRYIEMATKASNLPDMFFDQTINLQIYLIIFDQITKAPNLTEVFDQTKR